MDTFLTMNEVLGYFDFNFFRGHISLSLFCSPLNFFVMDRERERDLNFRVSVTFRDGCYITI